MTNHQLKPWSQVVHLHADVEAGDTAVATYAIDLGALVAGDPNVPRVYCKAQHFFEATHLTSGLRRLLDDVLTGLTGDKRDRVLQLRSPFGGGKSHILAALYHAAHERDTLNVLPEGIDLPDPGPVRVAVFDGEKFDVQGREINGHHVQTMWGALAAQLGCYDAVAYHDQNRISPGGDVIADMLGKQSTLLLLDEVLKYLERASALRIGDTTLGRLVQEFLQSLSVEVARTSHAVMVYSLQASAKEAYGDEVLLNMLDHLTSRVDAKREPVIGDEIMAVLRRRLLSQSPDTAVAKATAEAFATAITNMMSAHAVDEASRLAAEDDRLALRDRITTAYPFHPALIDIMTERWASLPDFQRTRGALRFLSVCLHTLKRENRARELLGPGDIPIEDDDVAHAFFTEVGQREPFKSVIQRDFTGPNARVKRIDDRMAAEHPSLSGVCPATRIATAILAYSFGGLLQQDEEGGEPIAAGVTESELLVSVVGPDLDSITAETVLKRLREQCLFLHYDGARYAFKTTPNVTQVLEDVATHQIKPNMIEKEIKEEMTSRLAGRASAILWPASSDVIPHEESRFLLAYLPLDLALQGDTIQKQHALDLLSQYGDQPRRYRNGLGLAVPERTQVENLRHATRYLQAIKRIRTRRAQLNLTTSQMQQLKDRENTEKAAFESSIRDLYQSVWLPVMIEGKLDIEAVTMAGRPLAAHGVHERLIELLMKVSPPKVFTTVTADKIVELMRLGIGENAPLAVNLAQIVESFYSVPGFPRLESASVLQKAIAEGVEAGTFGYVGRTGEIEVDRLRESSEYSVSPKQVRIGTHLPEAQVDMSTGFIVLPEAVEPETPAETTEQDDTALAQTAISTEITDADTTLTGTTGQTASQLQATVNLRMWVNRQQVYATTNALANLAQQAGSIRVTVEAYKPEGFDPNWLQNAVLEPLDEAEVELDE
jgi:hypothetical protein